MNSKRLLLTLTLLVAVFANAQDMGTWTWSRFEVHSNAWVGDPEGDWSMSQNGGSCSVFAVSWENPPQEIPVGQEKKSIAIPFQCQLYDRSKDYGVWGGIRVGKADASGTEWPHTNRRGLWETDREGVLCPDGSLNTETQYVKLDRNAELYVTITPFYLDNQLRHVSKTATFVYTYNPPGTVIHDEVDPPVDPGEFKGDKDIPWGFIIGGVAALTMIGAAIAVVKKTKKTEQQKKTKEPASKKEEVAHSTFRMILYKDFGDTLLVGDEPRFIGARIEEITPLGEKIDRPDLTAKITILAEENCALSEVSMSERYMSAGIVAIKVPENEAEGIAKVRFLFNGPYGTLINHVTFKVAGAPEIIVGEGLTFEAGGGKTRFIEFLIYNYKGVVNDVQVTIEKRAESLFRSELEVDKDDPYKFRINITECGPKRSAGEEHHISGDADCYFCSIVANVETMKEPIRASFNLYRMNLGVSLFVHALKAYLVDYHSTFSSEVLPTQPGRKMKWGESQAYFKLIVEDQSSGDIKSVIPDTEPVFSFEDVAEGRLLFADRFGNEIYNLCQLMNFQFDLRSVDSDNTVRGVIRSHGGGLLSPNRAKAKVTVSVSYQGKSYTDSVLVPVISQPYRDISDTREYNATIKREEEQLKKLISIRSKIGFDPRFAGLMPFYYKVNAMVEGYSPEFGLSQPDYEKIMKAYNDYCSGKIGHYFVNNAVWTPAWTETDENFNAFVATYGEMERSWYGIGARIALGYFTAGASELVLTPASGLVKLKEYVDKGGDSAYEGFKTVSSEIIFWEGVFYAGGMAVKWVGGKAKDIAEKTGLTNKLKKGYEKIKQFVTGAEKSKNVSEGLCKPPVVNTRQLGDRVKKATEGVKQTKSAAAAKANEAIRRTLDQGDDALRFGSSKFNEECAKWAKQDGQKILDNFKKVMNDPAATPEQMRRATLALQGNKAAQNLLRESPSDMLRANFNANLKKIYQEADQLTMEELAARLGVKKSDIRVWDGASANSNKDLYLGKKIGADRDVTFQVKGKDGKWVDIREDIMEQAYADAFTQYHYGFMPKDQQEAIKTLRKFDQAVVNGETGLESFGKDLKNIIVKELQTSKLMDPEKVAKTVKYKCEFWLNQGKSCRSQAEQLYNAGLIDEAKHVMGYGEELVKEGVRMNVKEFKRILDPRIQALNVKGAAPKDYSVLYEKIKVLEAIGTPPPKNVPPLSLEQARQVLQKQYGTTIEEVVNECTNVIQEVNPYL